MTLTYRPLLIGTACLLAVSSTAAGVTIARAAQAQPTVTGVSPAGGSTEGGAVTIITGTNFYNGTSASAVASIQFGSTTVVKSTDQCTAPPPSSVGCFTVNSDTQITATTPPHRQAITQIQVTTPSGISPINPLDQFTYTAPPPKAANLLDPISGAPLHSATGGISLEISPSDGVQETSAYDFATSVNFVPASGQAYAVTTTPCPVATVSAGPQGCFSVVGDLIIVRTPFLASSTTVYDVTVTTAGGTSPVNTATDQFTLISAFDTLDVFGGLHAVPGSQPAPVGPSFGFNIARGFAPLPGTSNQGYVLDGWGGIHPVGGAPSVGGGPYWRGWDIARGIVLRADGSGYVLDGFGGLHPFGGAPTITGEAYFPGWDIVRGVVLLNNGVSGYTLDGWGGLHPFGGAPVIAGESYWPGWDIARGFVLRTDGVSGYTLDGWGGVHAFGGAPSVTATSYWPGWDIARAVVLLPDLASLSFSPGGYVLDGWGGLHQFGSAPAAAASYYLAGHDVVRSMGAL